MNKFPNKIGNDQVSDLQILNSAAGWYIGRSYLDTEFGENEWPYSRESGYYASKEEAENALDTDNFEVRRCIENDAAYANGSLPYPKKRTK